MQTLNWKIKQATYAVSLKDEPGVLGWGVTTASVSVVTFVVAWSSLISEAGSAMVNTKQDRNGGTRANPYISFTS
jgi:hypothetical protein